MHAEVSALFMSAELSALLASRALERVLWPWPSMQLWLARLSSFELQRREILWPDEAARANRFVFDADRRRYVAAHVALHLVLQDANAAAARRPFETGEHGKPALAAGAMPHFNLSHSGDWALIGTSAHQEIGVDIEAAREIDDMAELAQRLFTKGERGELALLRGRDRQRGFFHAWTRKEACVKAVGTGLFTDVSKLDAGLGPGPRTLDLEFDAGTYQIRVDSFDLGPQLVLAVAQVVARRVVPRGAAVVASSGCPST